MAEEEPTTPLVRTHRAWRIFEWILVGLGALMLAAGALGFWALRSGRAAKLVEGRVVSELRRACGVELRFVALRIEPTSASVHLSGLELETAEGAPLLSVGRAFAELRLLPLLRGRIEIPKITLDQPRATLRLANGVLVDLPACLASGESGASRPPPLGLEEVSLEGGRFRLVSDDDVVLDLDEVAMSAWPGRSGGTELTLRIGGGTLAVDGRVTPLGGLRLVAHAEGALLAPRAIQLEQLQASLGPLDLDASGELDLLGPVYDLSVGLRADLAALATLAPNAPAMAGSADLRVDLSGVALEPRVAGTLLVRGGRIAKYSLGRQTTIRLRADASGVSLDEVVVELGSGRARAKGRIEFDDELTLQATAWPEQLSFARVMDALGEEGVWADFEATGVSRVKGSLRPLRIEGPLDFQVNGVDVWNGPWDDPKIRRSADARMLDVVPVRVKGRWTFTEPAIELVDLELSTERSRGRASALIRHGEPKRLQIDADFARLGLADLGGIGGIDFRGSGPLTARLGGPFGKLTAGGTINFEGISIAGIPLGAAEAEVRWDGAKRLSVASIEGTLGATRWHGDVDVNFEPPTPVRVRGEVTRGRLGDLLLPLEVDPDQASVLEGDVRATFELDGPVSAWSGPVQLSARGVRASGEGLGDLAARGRLDRGRVVVESLVLTEGDAKTTAQGWLLPAAKTFELSSTTTGLRLSQLELLSSSVPSLDGRASAQAKLSGPLTRPVGRVDVDLDALRADDLDLGGGRIELEFTGSEVELTSRLPKVGVRVDGGAKLVAGLPYTAAVVVNRASLPTTVGVLIGLDLTGTASVDAQLSGNLAEITRSSGRLRVGLLHTVLAGTSLDLKTPVDIAVERGALMLDDVRVSGSDVRFTATGPVGADRLDLALDGRLDLRLLSGWVPSIERSAGSFRFAGSVRRAGDGIDLVGSGRIEDGALEWRGVPNRFSAIRGELNFSQRSILVEHLTARWAGGRLAADGSMLLDDLVPRAVALSARVEGPRPRFPLAWMDLSARLDGQVEVTGDWPNLLVSGEVEAREGRAVPRTDLSELVGARRLAAAYDPSAEVVELDVALPLLEPFRVKNDDIDVALGGELRLTGTNERLGLLGSLNLDRGGRITVVGREYVTESGVIEMRDRYRVEPRYDLGLSTSACDARIQLGLVGDLDDVQTSYTSNPEMDREDIVSCLVRGVKRRDLDQDLASFAGSALLKLSGVDRQVKRVLPIDQIDVTTEYSSRARAYEPRLLVAKDLSLLGRQVRLEYSNSLFTVDDQRAALRVRLTPRLSLQLGWTSSEDVPTGDWGLDLKRRWEW